MKKNGFTLVELLAVIVILAIILAIAVPGISGIVNNVTKQAFESDAKMLITAINYKLMEDDSLNPSTINETNVESVLKVSDDNYQTVTISTLRGKPYVVLSGKNKWASLVAYGSSSNMSVTDSSNYTTIINQLSYDTNKGANEPKLTTGITPIKWNGTTWVETTVNDRDWYDYNTTDKKWANARTADGSMWVWIPRYVYRISSNWHTNIAGTIDVQFSMGTDDTRGGTVTLDTGTTSDASNNKWTKHPAFTFGDTELTGIWVAKFEMSGTTTSLDSKPGVVSLRNITISEMFTASRNMETNNKYGWSLAGGLSADGTFTTDTNNIDTHVMKNSEWGAVTYLSKSTYGQNTNEIWINNANDYTTGCAANSATEGASTTGCLNAYNTTNGVNASTTGTIYGVYDMLGGAWERVSAYVDNANGNLNTYGAPIINAHPKYKDIYTMGATDTQTNNYALTINKKGDAIYETSNNINGFYSWFGDCSYMSNTTSPWVLRGGNFDYNPTAGVFAFSRTSGSANSTDSFRSVLLVGPGL